MKGYTITKGLKAWISVTSAAPSGIFRPNRRQCQSNPATPTWQAGPPRLQLILQQELEFRRFRATERAKVPCGFRAVGRPQCSSMAAGCLRTGRRLSWRPWVEAIMTVTSKTRRRTISVAIIDQVFVIWSGLVLNSPIRTFIELFRYELQADIVDRCWKN